MQRTADACAPPLMPVALGRRRQISDLQILVNDMAKRIIVAAWLMGLIASTESVGTARFPQPGTQLAPAGVPQDSSALGYLNLHKRHPNAAEGAEEFNTGYSSDQALRRLTQMQGFLASFSHLTRQARGKLTAAQLAAVGNTSAEMQTIGFHNIPLTVEGTLLKQDYQLRQVQYELAQLKRQRGGVSVQELDRAKGAYEAATKRFQIFWDTKLPTD